MIIPYYTTLYYTTPNHDRMYYNGLQGGGAPRPVSHLVSPPSASDPPGEAEAMLLLLLLLLIVIIMIMIIIIIIIMIIITILLILLFILLILILTMRYETHRHRLKGYLARRVPSLCSCHQFEDVCNS